MKIRKATPTDAACLAESCVQIARFMREGETDRYIDGFPNEADPAMVAWARGHTESDDRAAFMAESSDGRFLGCIFGKITESSMPLSVSEPIGEISVCWVEPDRRKSGVGRALCTALENWFRARGIRHLVVAYMAKNTTAGEAWTHLGYTPFHVFAYKEFPEEH